MDHPAKGASVLRALAAGILSIAVAGCSVLNPHVDPGLPRPQLAPDKDAKGQPIIKFYGDLPAAIDYANSLRQEYYDAVGEQSLLRNGMALTLAPVSAVALFLGINSGTDASRTAITALGIGGASVYALGDFLYSKPRQAIYLAGSEAVGCAILASRPFLVPAEEMDDFKKALDAAYPAVDQVALELARFEGVKLNEADKAYAAAVRAKLAEAAKLVAQGEAANGLIETAALTLVAATDTIRDQVSVQIVKDEPDFAAIQGLIGGLGPLAKQIGPAPPTPPPSPKAGTPQASTASVDSADLDEAVQILSGHLGKIARMISRLEASRQTVSDIQACKPAGAANALKIEPGTEVTFAAQETGTKGLIVSGGNSPYIAELLDIPTGGNLVVSQPAPFGPRINIEKKGAVPENTYNVRVADSAGNSVLVQVAVAAGQGDQQDDNPSKGGGGSAEVRAAQLKLFCTKDGDPRVDGDVGPLTEAALRIYRDAYDSKNSGPPTAAELGILADLAICPEGARNQYEAKLLEGSGGLVQIAAEISKPELTSVETIRNWVMETAQDRIAVCGVPPLAPPLTEYELTPALGLSPRLVKFVVRSNGLNGDATKSEQLCAPILP